MQIIRNYSFKTILLLLSYTISFSVLKAQQTTVKCYIDPSLAKHGRMFYIIPPIDSVQHFYSPDTSYTYTLQTDSFEIHIPKLKGWTTLSGLPQRIYIDTYTDSTIIIRYIKKDSDVYVNFEGQNAAGLDLLNGNTMFDIPSSIKIIDSIFNKGKSPALTIKQLNQLYQQNADLVNSYPDNKINASFKKRLLSELATNVYGITLLRLNDNRKTIQKENVTFLLKAIDSIYHPFDISHIYSIFGESVALNHAKFINEGLVSSSKNYPKLYQDYWNKFPPEYAIYAYLPNKYQELEMAGNVYVRLMTGIKEADLSATFNLFRKYFPKSDYVKILAPYVKEEVENEKNNGIEIKKAPTLFQYTPNGKIFHILDSTTAYSSLAALLQKFRGKYVFIDFWASWCLPCLSELPYYKNSFSAYLNRKKIIPLFINIDANTTLANANYLVKKYEIEGFHYYSGNKNNFIKDLMQLLYHNKVMTIPHYVLVDPKGNILLSDAKRPSEGIDLINQIDSQVPND